MDALPPAIRARLFPSEELRRPTRPVPPERATPAAPENFAANPRAKLPEPTFTSSAPALTTHGARALGGWDTPVDPLQLVWQHGLERDDFEGF